MGLRFKNAKKVGSTTKAAAQVDDGLVIDLTDGNRDLLLRGGPHVESLDLVGLKQGVGGPAAIARAAGLLERGARDALVVRRGEDLNVVLVVTPEENPEAFTRRQKKSGRPQTFPVGRLSVQSERRFRDLLGDADARAVLVIDGNLLDPVIELRIAVPPP